MKQYTNKLFTAILSNNGYHLDRTKGSHYIYINEEGKHISIPHKLKCVIARRLIKENGLKE